VIDGATCAHLEATGPARAGAVGCEECLRTGEAWFHLRQCIDCGHVGCCDRSPNQHATAHYRATGHPVMRSFEPGEDWRWCFVDEVAIGLD
jgi:uncharacterized UBP type Zn finger protein